MTHHTQSGVFRRTQQFDFSQLISRRRIRVSILREDHPNGVKVTAGTVEAVEIRVVDVAKVLKASSEQPARLWGNSNWRAEAILEWLG